MSVEEATLKWDKIKFSLIAIGAVVAFFWITVPMSCQQSEKSERETEQQTTPRLGIRPVVSQLPSTTAIKHVAVDLVLENVGEADISIGKVDVYVSVGQLNDALQLEFERFENELEQEQDQALELIPPLPSTPNGEAEAPPPDEASEKPLGELLAEAMQQQRQQAQSSIAGRLYSVEGTGVSWKSLPNQQQTRELDLTLQKGQKRSVRLSYMIAPALEPRWYRFEIVARPVTEVESKWSEQQVEATILITKGSFGHVEVAVQKSTVQAQSLVLYDSEAILAPTRLTH